MPFADRGQPVEVNVECPCPGTPHPSGDTVYLKPEADVPMTLAFNVTWQNVASGGLTVEEFNADMQAAMAGVYLRHSITGWTFVDEKGEIIRVRPSTIATLLPPHKGGLKVAEVADELYSATLVAPLQRAVEKAQANLAIFQNRELRRQKRKSSRAGRTATSTSAPTASGASHPSPSAPSSPANTAGKRSTA